MADPLFIVVEGAGPIIATAIHDGHALRAECSAAMALDDASRLREEDPFTGRIAAVAPTHLIATRSRFEVDLNRPRDKAVYATAEDAWGLDVWQAPPSRGLCTASLEVYDAFYAELERVIRARIERHGRICVLDCHSYNHRRDRVPADPATNPEINLGTGSVDHARWGRLVHRFYMELGAAGPFDVRENVKFQGGWMARWIHQTFPASAVCLALEVKKTFMDEWTGEVDEAHLARLTAGVAATLPGLGEELAR